MILIFSAVWLSALAKCDSLTEQYYDDFKTGHLQTGFHDELEYFKVLSCDGETAAVYYIAKDHANGCVLDFERREGEWIMTEWNCIWSDYGSASDVIWPYWWHFIMEHGMASGNVVTFQRIRTNSAWEVSDWVILWDIWNTENESRNFVYPYWWDYFYAYFGKICA